MKFIKTFGLATVATFIATAALAENYTGIDRLPQSGNVSVQGRVVSLDGNNWVTVTDGNNNNVRVLLSQDQYNSLRANQDITINGSVKTVNGNRQIYAKTLGNQSGSATKAGRKLNKGEYLNNGNSTGEDMNRGSQDGRNTNTHERGRTGDYTTQGTDGSRD